jgi:hypothetical protein
MRRTRLKWGAAGALLLVALGYSSVSGRDDKPPKAEEAKKAEKAAEPVEAKKVDKLAAAEDDADLQWVAQFGGYFRQYYKTELRFMRMTTQPTKQQYEKIAAEAEPSVKVAMRMYVKRINGQGANNSSDPTRPMTEAITKAIKQHLSPEQAAQYEKELAARVKAHKRMAVDNLVVMVDKALLLSADQRQKLVDILDNNWDDSWHLTQYFWNNGRWYPPMPDSKILPILTALQKLSGTVSTRAASISASAALFKMETTPTMSLGPKIRPRILKCCRSRKSGQTTRLVPRHVKAATRGPRRSRSPAWKTWSSNPMQLLR